MEPSAHFFDKSVSRLTEMQNQLSMSSYGDHLNTAQVLAFKNTTTTPPAWSYVDFVPEKVVDLSVTMDGLRFYKVQWHHSWVAEHQLLPFQHVLQDFWAKENEDAISNKTSKKLTVSKESVTKLPSISNWSCTATNVKKKETHISSTANKTAVEPSRKVVAPLPVGLPSTCSNSETVSNEISGKPDTSESKHSVVVDQTLATGIRNTAGSRTRVITNTGDTGNSAIVDTVTAKMRTIENIDTLTSSSIKSDLEKSYEQEISKVLVRKTKYDRPTGRNVECDGLDIIGVENTNITDDMVRAKARETLASFKKKRRKYENGESYKDPHSCYFCMKVFAGGKNVRWHIFQVHLKLFGHLICDICQKRFFHAVNLRNHQRTHSEEYKWECAICKSVFKSSAGLRQHMKVHEKESNFRCDVCHKNFKLQADLKTHCVEDHNDKSETCNVCKSKLSSGYSVYIHSLRHSGTRDYQCDECGRSFKDKQCLSQHKMTHSAVKNRMECPVCKRSFTARSALLTHLATFHKEYATAWRAKFKCSICDKPFCLKGTMENHIKLRHANETREDYQKRKLDKQQRKGFVTALNISDEDLARLSEKVEKVTNEKTGEVRLRCKLCAQTYLIVTWMEKHLEDHKNGNVNRHGVKVCRDCGAKFRSKYHLLKHRNNHCHDHKAKTKKTETLKLQKTPKTPKSKTVNDDVMELKGKPCKNLCKDCGKCYETKKRLQLHRKISHPKLKTSGANRGAVNSSINDDESNPDQKKTRKRKQQLPLKLDERGKRSAALNAKSMLHLQVQEASSDDEDPVLVVSDGC